MKFEMAIPEDMLAVGEGIFTTPTELKVGEGGEIHRVSYAYRRDPSVESGISATQFAHVLLPDGSEDYRAIPLSPRVVRFSRMTPQGPVSFLGITNR